MLDSKQILGALKHRYPFVLVDRIIDFKQNEYAIGIKNITMNEFWTQGHFEDDPIFPGVLLIEACAQTGAFIFYDENSDKPLGFAKLSSIPYFKFIRSVIPGDQLVIRTDYVESFANVLKVKILVTVDGKRTAEGEVTYAFIEPK